MEITLQRTANFLIVAVIGLSAFQPEILKAQQNGPTAQAGVADAGSPSAAQQTAEILRMVAEMREELKDSRHEVEDLKKEVNELREELAASTQAASGAGPLKSAVDELRDDQQVVESQVKTLDQTKVGTESRYPVRITGMVLLNSYVVDGAVDNPILPLVALPRTSQSVHHSLGATVSQTQLGLDATGPRLWNARTSADIAADFFSSTSYTTIPPPANTMNLRLRTVDVNLDWKNAQVSAGQQTPLITPLSPTSFASIGEPALSWAGNLWTWLPQATFTYRKPFTDTSHGVFAFGLLDPEAGNVTGEQAYGVLRRNLQPGYEGRVAYEWGSEDRPYEIGGSGYYSRQLYYGNGTTENQPLDFWAGTADWRVPLAKFADLSGEFYRGRGIGDLGGGAFKNVVIEYGSPYASGLNAIGGWTQLKFRITPTLEANAFYGEDSAQTSQVRNQPPATTSDPYYSLVRNQSVAMNLIFRPKTYLVFAGEYRYLQSWYVYGSAKDAQTLNLTMGYLF